MSCSPRDGRASSQRPGRRRVGRWPGSGPGRPNASASTGGKGSCEQALARRLFPQLEQDWLLIADRGFYNWADWQAAAATGAALLWRVKADLRLPVLELLPDGSYLSIVVRPAIHDKARNKLIAAARAGEHLDPGGCGLHCADPKSWAEIRAAEQEQHPRWGPRRISGDQRATSRICCFKARSCPSCRGSTNGKIFRLPW